MQNRESWLGIASIPADQSMGSLVAVWSVLGWNQTSKFCTVLRVMSVARSMTWKTHFPSEFSLPALPIFPISGGLVLGCIEADFASKKSSCNIL